MATEPTLPLAPAVLTWLAQVCDPIRGQRWDTETYKTTTHLTRRDTAGVVCIIPYGAADDAQGRAVADFVATACTYLPVLVEQVEALRAFKNYVHARLDAAGIAAHQEQNARNGCRIGARLDAVLGLLPTPPPTPPCSVGGALLLPSPLAPIRAQLLLIEQALEKAGLLTPANTPAMAAA